MKGYYSFALLFLLSGCISKNATTFVPRIEENIPLSEDLTALAIEFSRELESPYRLYYYDSQVYFNEGISKFRIDYISQDSKEIREGRDVIVDVVEGFLDRINAHPTLSTSFTNFPVTVENLEIHISYQSYFNKYVDLEYLAYIIVDKGWTFFFGSELNMDYTDIWTKRIEPYYKTLQISNYQRAIEIPYKMEKESKAESILRSDRLFDHSTEEPI